MSDRTRKWATIVVAYAAASWVVIQVTTLVAPRVGLPDWIPTAVIVLAIAGLPISAAIAVLVHPFFAPTYSDEQVRCFREARSSILVSLHSLNPGASDPSIVQWRAALEQAILSGVQVSVLAPGGVERALAAYELAVLHRIPIRILDELEDQDLRFTLIDGETVLISHQPLGSKQLSKSYSVIHSRRLHTVLSDYFNRLWNDPQAMQWDAFLAHLCNSMKAAKDPATCRLLAERLCVPVSVVEAVLPDHPLGS